MTDWNAEHDGRKQGGAYTLLARTETLSDN